jgi:hypothetical protein
MAGRPWPSTPATNSIVLTWPASATNWYLVSATNLNSTNWTAVTNAVVATTNCPPFSLAQFFRRTVIQQFFRLRRNP